MWSKRDVERRVWRSWRFLKKVGPLCFYRKQVASIIRDARKNGAKPHGKIKNFGPWDLAYTKALKNLEITIRYEKAFLESEVIKNLGLSNTLNQYHDSPSALQ